MLAEGLGDCDFRGAATGNKGFLLHETADDAEGIVERTFRFVEDEVVGAATDDGDGLTGGFGGYPGDFDGAGAVRGDFFDEAGGAEFVFGKVFNVGYWFATGTLTEMSVALSICLPAGLLYFTDEFHFVSFNILDTHDVDFFEEMESIDVNCISQDRLLYQ